MTELEAWRAIRAEFAGSNHHSGICIEISVLLGTRKITIGTAHSMDHRLWQHRPKDVPPDNAYYWPLSIDKPDEIRMFVIDNIIAEIINENPHTASFEINTLLKEDDHESE